MRERAQAEAETQARAAQEAQDARATAAPGTRRARRRPGWRGPVASVLIVLGCVLAPVSVLAVWTSNQVSSTSRYVANVSPLIKEPSVQAALTDRISTALNKQIDVKAIASQAAKELSSRGLARLSGLRT